MTPEELLRQDMVDGDNTFHWTLKDGKLMLHWPGGELTEHVSYQELMKALYDKTEHNNEEAQDWRY